MDAALLEILVCPVTRSKLRREADFLVSEVGGLRYPIKDGLPVLLPDAAELPAGIKTLELPKSGHVTASFGVAECPGDAQTAAEILKAAVRRI